MRTLAAVLTLALLASSQVLAEDYDLDYVEMDSNTVIPPTETSAPVASTSNSMPMPTTTTPSPPSSSASTSPPPSSATPTPPVPANPEAQRYTLGDFGNSTQTCLNMTAVFKVLILNGTNAPVINVTLANNGQKGMIGEGSSCMTNELKATVYITESNQPSPFSVVMRFNGTDKYWSIEEIGLLINQEPFTANNSLDRNAVNVTKDRSFKCDSSVDYLMSNMTENPDKYSARVTISSLQVQVFRFKSNNGELGKVLSCTVDSKQNKIVPIAVGAALAGLVVVVLIAYLIGRLRSRKQSSYEALS